MEQLEEFKLETRAWLEENCPAGARAPGQLHTGSSKIPLSHPDLQLWLDRMAEKGWVTPTWDKAYGGAGLSTIEYVALLEEMKAIGARPPVINRGTTMAGPTILEFGYEEQIRRLLPMIARGEGAWCQGYSEPGAGSDLASLRTSAVADGDRYLINGQKIWTSDGHTSEWMFILVRTGPLEPKHDGISFFILNMDQPGVDARPIDLINGGSHFCETFFDDVKVSKNKLIGELNAGWAIAKALLQHERAFISSFGLASAMGSGRDLVSIAKKHVGEEDGKISNGFYRSQIASHKIKEHAFGLTLKRAKDEGGKASATASMFKLYGTEHNKRRHELMVAATGIDGVAWDGDEFDKKDKDLTKAWLRTKGNSIEGGTSEVQLNVISKRVLGLPS